MNRVVRILVACSLWALAASVVPVLADDHDSIVIVYKDGHRQTLVSSQIAKIDLTSPAAIVYKDGHREKVRGTIESVEFGDAISALPSRSHFIGKWRVGEGNGDKFYITLEANGDAKKTLGMPHGTWSLVDGEARILWDDGWHDAIRKSGTKHQKLAFEPGKGFDDTPSNITEAWNTEQKPI
jgi:hypothetical protein